MARRGVVSRVALLWTALGLVLAACSASAPKGHVQKGSAIAAEGLPTTGVVGFNASAVHVGGVYGFAFPLMKNVSVRPVSITSVEIRNLAAGTAVVGYHILSTADTSGLLMASTIGSRDKIDYATYPDYYGKPLTIPAHAKSRYYPVVYLTVTGPIAGHVTGCAVRYTQGQRYYQQVLPCAFSLDGTN
jgi:hypothetical protein